MHIIDEIEELVSVMYRRGEEFAPSVILGVRVYKELCSHAMRTTNNPYASANGGIRDFTIQTTVGAFRIKVDPTKPDGYIGMNGRTLLDIIVEQELLGI
jgi:hypothetical protein